MEAGFHESAGRNTHCFRITVRGELTPAFVEPLGEVFVESVGDESILTCEIIDQAKLQAVFGWLYERGIEIVNVSMDDGAAGSMDGEPP